MNGLLSLNPRLRTQGPNIANVLLAGQQMKEQREQRAFQNRLLEQRSNILGQQAERQQTQFGWAEEDRPLEQSLRALQAALLSPNPKDRQEIFKKFGGTGITFSPETKRIEFSLADGTEIVVPKNAEEDVLDYIGTARKDLTWATDPEKANRAALRLVSMGVSVKAPAVKEKKAPPRLYETEEGWQPRKEAIGLKKPGKEKAPTETQQQIDWKLGQTLRGLTHDKDGNPRDAVSASGLTNLNKTAAKYNKEVVKIDLSAIEDAPGLKWGTDIPQRSIYMLVDKDTADIDPQDLIDRLVTDYGMDPDNAALQVNQLLQGTQ